MYSLQTKMKALAIAGVMAASVAGGAVTAFAEGTAPKTIENTMGVPVSKTVKVAQGITLPKTHNETAFNFTAEFKASSNKDSALGGALDKFSLKLTGFENSEGNLEKEGYIAAAEDFERVVPGEYVYALTENEKTNKDEEYGWTCDASEYTLRVYVDKNHKVTYTVLKDRDYNLDVAEKNNKKLDRASFSNIYTKRGGSDIEDNPSLVVNKKVDGEYGNLDQYFKFTVTFDTPDTDTRTSEQKKFTMTFKGNGETGYAEAGNGEYSRTTSNIELKDEGTYVFYLKNGGSVSFDNLPAGTTYTLTETGVNGYTAKVTSVQNGGDSSVVAKGTEGNGVKAERLLIGEKKNTATVTNKYRGITITGVVTHSAPFVIMVGALFVAVGGYVVLKKRIEE